MWTPIFLGTNGAVTREKASSGLVYLMGRPIERRDEMIWCLDVRGGWGGVVDVKWGFAVVVEVHRLFVV